MNCRRLRTRDLKALAEKKLEQHDEARDEAFNDEFIDTFCEKVKLLHQTFYVLKEPINEDDIQGFLDSFTFPDENEWAFNEVQSDYESHCEEMADMARDEMIMERK